MYSISQVSRLTEVSAYTLRYYEKIGLLPAPNRKNGGSRTYTERQIRFITFLTGLKKTGMSLEDMIELVRDGCILEKIEDGEEIQEPSLDNRITILQKHRRKLDSQKNEIEQIIAKTNEKLAYYQEIRDKKRGGQS